MTTTNSATIQLLGLGNRIGARASEAVMAFADSLAAAVPDAATCTVMIVADDRYLTLHQRDASGSWGAGQRIGNSTGNGLDRQQMQAMRGRVLLRAGSGRSVTTRLTLPAATSEVLPQVVRNKVESLAPWPISEALWGYRLAGPPIGGHIQVDVGIVSRKTALALLHRVESAGAKISRFEVGHDGTGTQGIEIDIHGDDRRQLMRNRVKAAMSAVLAIAIMAGGYGGYLAYRTAAQTAAVEAAIADVQAALRNKDGAGGASQKLVQANALFARKRESRPVLELINTLSKLVPDGIWLSSLEIDGRTVTISGRGNQVPGVIATLESSDTFSDVNFASATQREADAAADSFSISASVEGKAENP